MLSKANIKFIKSLQVKKYRKQEQCFAVEGAKTVLELLASDFEPVLIVATQKFLGSHTVPGQVEIIEVSEKELESLGEFKTNNSVLAVARTKPNTPIDHPTDGFALVLDDIRDPGNLGTIIRTADWFGIRKIIASTETADLYNPKVIASTMGSFTRVQVFYTDISSYLNSFRGKIFGAFLDGEDVHRVAFGEKGLVVIGSESHGISPEPGRFVTNKITIPRYGEAESLNAAIAAAIICDNLRRNG